jgi:hypothetical protein
VLSAFGVSQPLWRPWLSPRCWPWLLRRISDTGHLLAQLIGFAESFVALRPFHGSFSQLVQGR